MSDIQLRAPSSLFALRIYNEDHSFEEDHYLDYILSFETEGGYRWEINEGKTITSNVLKIGPGGAGSYSSYQLFIGSTNNIEEMTSLFLVEDDSSIPDSIEIPQNLLSSPEYCFGIKLSGGEPLISEAVPNGAQVITSKSIQISCSTPSSRIYYTIDNTEPSSNSNLYSSLFSVNIGATIKAIGIKEGYLDSDIATLTV